MNLMTGFDSKFAADICDALGLKHVNCLTIHIPADDVITVDAKIYVEENGRLDLVLRHYKLSVEPVDGVPSVDAPEARPAL